MRVQAIVAQIKREFWGNRVGFIWVPLLCSFIMCAMAVFVATNKNFNPHYSITYSTDSVEVKDHTNYSITDKNNSADGAVTEVTTEHQKYWNTSSPDYLAKLVNATQASITFLLTIIFLVVFFSYAHECLYRDRETREILFWRSLPVSETTNVLIKVAIICIGMPCIVLGLSLFWSVIALVIGIGVIRDFSYFMPALLELGTSFKVLGGGIILAFGLLPVIGFMLLSSAFVKKSPARLSMMIPALFLALVFALVKYEYPLGLKILFYFDAYERMLTSMLTNYVNFTMVDLNTLIGYVIAILVGAGFIVASIWLRNNRYEI